MNVLTPRQRDGLSVRATECGLRYKITRQVEWMQMKMKCFFESIIAHDKWWWPRRSLAQSIVTPASQRHHEGTFVSCRKSTACFLLNSSSSRKSKENFLIDIHHLSMVCCGTIDIFVRLNIMKTIVLIQMLFKMRIFSTKMYFYLKFQSNAIFD